MQPQKFNYLTKKYLLGLDKFIERFGKYLPFDELHKIYDKQFNKEYNIK